MVLALLSHLKGHNVRVFDPVVSGKFPNIDAETAGSAVEAIQNADVVAIMTPWREFRDLDARDIAAAMRGRLIVDPYAVLNRRDCQSAGLIYRTLGVSAEFI